MKKLVVISLGGSIIYKDKIDVPYLLKFKELIERHLKEGAHRFVIVTGGGKLARSYQEALRPFTESLDSLDWVGIGATHANAYLVREIFKEHAKEGVLHDPTLAMGFDEDIMIASGWKPGWSTDYVAVMLAVKYGAKEVINLSNVEFVYSSDPREDANATKYGNMTWDEYLACIPREWSPGLSTPFDPNASLLAKEHGISVAILKGEKFEEIDKVLDEQTFDGTRIK